MSTQRCPLQDSSTAWIWKQHPSSFSIMSGTTRLQKLSLTLISVIVIFLFLTSFDVSEYQNYHANVSQVSGEQSYLTDANIKTGPLSESWIIDMIDNSHERVWVSVYTFTLPNMREALVRAHKRGVDVRVILEKFPFWNTTISRETETFLKVNNIPLHLSGEKQFAFMHAKFMVIDESWIVETANWTRASFSSNREFFIRGQDADILKNLIQIFESDFQWNIWVSRDTRLLAGPTNARERIIRFLQEAQSSVDIYAPSFSDKELLEELSSMCGAWKTVRILLADYDDSGAQGIQYDDCFRVHTMKKPLHAKVIIRDRGATFVGSFNYTKNSLERNREVWLFLSGEVTKSISQSFESDWKLSEVALR